MSFGRVLHILNQILIRSYINSYRPSNRVITTSEQESFMMTSFGIDYFMARSVSWHIA